VAEVAPALPAPLNGADLGDRLQPPELVRPFAEITVGPVPAQEIGERSANALDVVGICPMPGLVYMPRAGRDGAAAGPRGGVRGAGASSRMRCAAPAKLNQNREQEDPVTATIEVASSRAS
jgi:hypothetical protein